MCPRQCSTPGPLSPHFCLPPNNLRWSQCPLLHLFPSKSLCFPSICGRILLPLNLWGAEFPFKFFPPQFLPQFPPSNIVSSRTTLTRLPQWRYECFSDAINIQWETYFLAYFLDPLFWPLALHENISCNLSPCVRLHFYLRRSQAGLVEASCHLLLLTKFKKGPKQT